MLGKNHLISHTSVLVLSMSTLALYENNAFVQKIDTNLTSFFFPSGFGIAHFLIFYLFFIFGSLLPDVDNKKSMLGRYVYIPIEHRTWTHAIWIPLILFFFSSKIYGLSWIFLGYSMHIFFDSLSAKGVCFLYPFLKFKKFRILKIYRTGELSEYLIVIFLVSFAIFSFLFLLLKLM